MQFQYLQCAGPRCTGPDEAEDIIDLDAHEVVSNQMQSQVHSDCNAHTKLLVEEKCKNKIRRNIRVLGALACCHQPREATVAKKHRQPLRDSASAAARINTSRSVRW